MASWTLLLGYSGFRYDAQGKAIGFTPRSRTADFRCFFSTGTGWGDFSSHGGGVELEVRHGSLALSQVDVQLPAGSRVRKVCMNGRQLIPKADAGDVRTTLTFDTIVLTAGALSASSAVVRPPGRSRYARRAATSRLGRSRASTPWGRGGRRRVGTSLRLHRQRRTRHRQRSLRRPYRCLLDRSPWR